MAGTIVVGVDGSRHSAVALRWAHHEAVLRGADLEVVHAWHDPYVRTLTLPESSRPDLEREAADRLQQAVEDALAECSDDINIRTEIREGRAAPVLLDAARHADLVVVGSRGFPVFGGIRLGSVSQQVADHASCPVVVVR